MHLSSKITTDSNSYSLECFLNTKTGEVDKDWVWFEFSKIEAGYKDRPDITLVWDNSDYLINTFYPILQRFVSRTLTEEDKEEMKEVYTSLENDAEEILEIFEKAKELNWFKI